MSEAEQKDLALVRDAISLEDFTEPASFYGAIEDQREIRSMIAHKM